METFTQGLNADHCTLSTVRGALRSWLDMHAASALTSESAMGDVDLVVTELAANVVDHSGSPWVDVAVTTTASGMDIAVGQDGDAAGLPDAASWSTVPDGDRGHGLRIVEALCTEVAVERNGETTVVRCRFVS